VKDRECTRTESEGQRVYWDRECTGTKSVLVQCSGIGRPRNRVVLGMEFVLGMESS
jgi:hypothetical protein